MKKAAQLVRGVRRWLADQGFESACEVPVGPHLRADILALGRDGEIWIIEVKSGPADFRADQKWRGYRAWCDQLLFAVDAAFPGALLPEDTGAIRADAFEAALVRPGPVHKLAPTRRKAMILKVARLAARRLHRVEDPGAAGLETDGGL